MRRWLALAIALSACARSSEKVEADEVRAAIDRLRASNADDLAGRRALVGELEKKPAALKEAKRARDACATAYKTLVEARELAARAKAGISAPDRSAAAALADLDGSEKKLAEATAAMPACDAASATLKVTLSH